MVPTFRPGDRIFVNKFLYGARIPFTGIRLPGIREPKRGDIIVFKSPVEKNKYLVKRLVALPGDAVEIRDHHIWINGRPLEEPLSIKAITYYNKGEYGREGQKFKVPRKSFYVLGDNSLNSVDSRYWGFVPEENLAGKVFLIHWPVRRIRIVR